MLCDSSSLYNISMLNKLLHRASVDECKGGHINTQLSWTFMYIRVYSCIYIYIYIYMYLFVYAHLDSNWNSG